MTKFEAIFEDFQNSLRRFEEVIQEEKSTIVRDSAIKRFEITIDLSWKALKTFLQEHRGIVCRAPKSCVKEAFQQGVIEHDEVWLEMVDLRNEAAHTYKEELAEKLYNDLPKIVERFQSLEKKLKDEVEK
jgi:nucleotidyltransferase substrate binding protein (TIGR01987 family)